MWVLTLELALSLRGLSLVDLSEVSLLIGIEKRLRSGSSSASKPVSFAVAGGGAAQPVGVRDLTSSRSDSTGTSRRPWADPKAAARNCNRGKYVVGMRICGAVRLRSCGVRGAGVRGSLAALQQPVYEDLVPGGSCSGM